MVKRITRYGKLIRAEVYYLKQNKIWNTIVDEIHVDSKDFNTFYGTIFREEPTDEHYQKANEWADDVIEKHKRNTQ